MIELLIAMTVLAVGILAVFTLFESGLVELRRAGTVATASALAESQMENFRAARFSAIGLSNTEVAAADATYSGDTAYVTDTPATTASSALTTTAVTMTVPSAASFGSPPFRIKIDSEILLVTAVSTVAGSSSQTWSLTRAQDSTAAATHSTGATVQRVRRVNLAVCGTSPCTTWHPTETKTGADGRTYRVDNYVSWQTIASSGGTTGRMTKLVTVVVRRPGSPKVWARVTSTFDELTGS